MKNQPRDGIELADLEWLKFDPRILLYPLKQWKLLIFTSALLTLGYFLTVHNLFPHLYHTEAILVRNNRVINPQNPFPSVYAPLDISSAAGFLATKDVRKDVQLALEGKVSAKEIEEGLDVEQKSSLLYVRAKNQDPQKATDIANAYVESFLSNMSVQQDNTMENLMGGYFKQEEKIKQQIATTKEKMREHSTLEGGGDVLQRTQDLQKKIAELTASIETLTLNLEQNKILHAQIKNDQKKTPSQIPDNSRKNAELARLNQQLSVLKKRYTEANPKIIRLRARIRAVRSGTWSEKIPNPKYLALGEQLQTLELKSMREQALLSGYEDAMLKLTSELKQKMVAKKNIEALKGEIAEQQLTLATLRQTRTQLQLSASIQNQDFKVSQYANVPKEPKMQWAVLFTPALGVFFFVFFYILLVLRRLWNFPVVSLYDFEHILGVSEPFLFPKEDLPKKNARKLNPALNSPLNPPTPPLIASPTPLSLPALGSMTHKIPPWAKKQLIFMNNLFKLSHQVKANARHTGQATGGQTRGQEEMYVGSQSYEAPLTQTGIPTGQNSTDNAFAHTTPRGSRVKQRPFQKNEEKLKSRGNVRSPVEGSGVAKGETSPEFGETSSFVESGGNSPSPELGGNSPIVESGKNSSFVESGKASILPEIIKSVRPLNYPLKSQLKQEQTNPHGVRVFFASDVLSSGKEGIIRHLCRLWKSRDSYANDQGISGRGINSRGSMYVIHVLFPFLTETRLPKLNHHLQPQREDGKTRFFSCFRGDADGVWHAFFDASPLLLSEPTGNADLSQLLHFFTREEIVVINVEGFKYNPLMYRELLERMDCAVLMASAGHSRRKSVKKLHAYLSQIKNLPVLCGLCGAEPFYYQEQWI